jgi:hypothetical protein
MAVLSSGARAALPSSSFALPGHRFPIEDKTHAMQAIRLAPRSEAAGNLTPAQDATIHAKVRARYGIGSGTPTPGGSLMHRMVGKLMA